MTHFRSGPNGLFLRHFKAAALGLSAAFSSIAFGQSTVPNDAAPEDGVELEALVVTGSFIPVTLETSFASPVTTVSRAEIARTGEGSNLFEAIRKSVPQFSGDFNVGNSNAHTFSAETGGGAQLALRNANTLVLVDNRRVAFSPITATGGHQFVDLNLIPSSAVERVEVFKDGASAIYGSDATAGVVNIIMRSDFEGVEVNSRFAISPNEGHWSEERVGFAAGARDGNLRVFAAGEWNESDPLWLHERDFSDPVYASFVFGGVAMRMNGDAYVLNPDLAAPPPGVDLTPGDAVGQGIYAGPFGFGDLATGSGDAAPYAFNLAEHETLLLSEKRRSLLADLEYEIAPTFSAFANILYSNHETRSQLNAQPIETYITRDHPHNPFDEDVFAFNRFTENPRAYLYDTTSWRMVGGLRGELAPDLHFEAGAMHNIIDQDFANPGVLDSEVLRRLIGTAPDSDPSAVPVVNIFARAHDREALMSAFGVGTSEFRSTLSTFDFRLHGKGWSLPAGQIEFAAGVEHRREKLSGTADERSRPDAFGNPGWTGASALQPFTSSRNVSSAFVELRMPLIGGAHDMPGVHSLTLELAARHERYSDTDDPTVPRASLVWQPVSENLMFRATYSESFNAPTLYSLSGPVDIGFSESLFFVPLGANQPARWGQTHVRGTSNPALDPSESESVTAGILWSLEAVPGFTIALDYFRIREVDQIRALPLVAIAQDVESLGPDSVYASQVRIGGFDGSMVSAPGKLYGLNPSNVYITSGLLNLASREMRGLDLELSYGGELRNLAYLNIESRWTWYDRYSVRVMPGSALQETASRATSLNGTIPEWRVYNTASLRFDALTFFVGHSYIPSMLYQGAPAGEHMGSFQTLDLAAGYDFSEGFANGLSLRIGVNNVANEMPPLAPELFSQSNADIATYSPIGRLFFAEATYRF